MNTKLENDLYFISCAWNTGVGFAVKDYNFIITSVQIVGFSKYVTVRNSKVKKHLAQVLFVDYSLGLAFIEKKDNLIPQTDIINFELSVIEQPVDKFSLSYFNKITKSTTEAIDSGYTQNNINYLLLKDLHSEKCASNVVFNKKGDFVGITKFVHASKQCFVIPAKYLLKAMEAFTAIEGEESIRCPNCLNVVKRKNIVENVCPVCTAQIRKEILDDLLPSMTETDKKIEEIIVELGYDIRLSRLGLHLWEIQRGSAIIFVRYEPELKFIAAFSALCDIDENNSLNIKKFMLNENTKLNFLSFSLNNNKVFLNAPYLIDDTFDKGFAKNLFEELFEKADYYDDIIIDMQKTM
jgi:serine protease Do